MTSDSGLGTNLISIVLTVVMGDDTVGTLAVLQTEAGLMTFGHSAAFKVNDVEMCKNLKMRKQVFETSNHARKGTMGQQQQKQM